MANLLGDGDARRPADAVGDEPVLAHPDASLHWYGKREVYPLRKMGHLTVVGDGARDADGANGADLDRLLGDARELREAVTFE